jgi:hypothetical protein
VRDDPVVGIDQARRGSVALVRVELTEREARSLVRAATLVADVLRPELFSHYDGETAGSPLITASQVLIAACERAGVNVGLAAGVGREPR